MKNISSQLKSQTGMGRQGGMASRGSTPVPASKGSSFAAMQSMLNQLKRPDPVKMTLGKPSRQFVKLAAGGPKKFGSPRPAITSQPGPAVMRTAANRTVPPGFSNRNKGADNDPISSGRLPTRRVAGPIHW